MFVLRMMCFCAVIQLLEDEVGVDEKNLRSINWQIDTQPKMFQFTEKETGSVRKLQA